MQVLLLKWNEKPDPELDPRSLSNAGGARPAGHLGARLPAQIGAPCEVHWYCVVVSKPAGTTYSHWLTSHQQPCSRCAGQHASMLVYPEQSDPDGGGDGGDGGACGKGGSGGLAGYPDHPW